MSTMSEESKVRLRQQQTSQEREHRYREIDLESIETFDPQSRMKLKHVPKKHLKTFARAVLGKATRSQAIRAFCQSCFGYCENLQAEIKNCPSTSCPLWHHRPYRQKTKATVEIADAK